jgi:hypothetical protein
MAILYQNTTLLSIPSFRGLTPHISVCYNKECRAIKKKDAHLSGVRSNDLLGCPFCGSEVYHESTITEEVIRCTLCPASMIYGESFEALKSMWNYRAT